MIAVLPRVPPPFKRQTFLAPVSASFLVDTLSVFYHKVLSGSKKLGSGKWNAKLDGSLPLHLPGGLTHSKQQPPSLRRENMQVS